MVNLTPHPVRIFNGAGVVVREILASGMVARLKMDRADAGSLDGLLASRVTYGGVEGLPAPEEGTFFLVSLPTALALVGQRDDLLVIDREVREDGTIVGCRGLARPCIGR
ncbi:hypothetical protein IEJ02_12075 [Streptomyces sp. 5-10]|nr:hypothetical protein [Streptomyces sp. 5-10]